MTSSAQPGSATHEYVLQEVFARAGGDTRAEVDARALMGTIPLSDLEFYKTIVALCDAGFLEYLGAGPRVRLTALGWLHCSKD